MTKKNVGGRPTLYTPEINDRLLEYFDKDPAKWELLPSVSGFCRKEKIHRDTFYQWLKDHKDFSDTFVHCKEALRDFINGMALLWFYNPFYSKFVAINMTDMVDKKEVDTRHSWSIATANIDLSEEQKKIIAQQILWSQTVQ